MRNCKAFVVFPSADPGRAAKAAGSWKQMGYQVGVYMDYGVTSNVGAYAEWNGPYNGYWDACNYMAHVLVNGYERANVVVFAADDIEPDATKTSQEIASEFLERFPDTFGVMQPCGDPQGVDVTGKPAAARICGSPWVGAEWVRRAYQGRGACDARYFHYYGDESLYEVAHQNGALWMRPDLTQYHRHWSWGHDRQQVYQKRNSSRHWEKDKALFMAEKAAGFPNSEPLPA